MSRWPRTNIGDRNDVPKDNTFRQLLNCRVALCVRQLWLPDASKGERKNKRRHRPSQRQSCSQSAKESATVIVPERHRQSHFADQRNSQPATAYLLEKQRRASAKELCQFQFAHGRTTACSCRSARCFSGSADCVN